MARKYHIYKNENPLKKKTCDCVIRTLASATNNSWDDVYKELCEIGFELKETPTTDNVWKEYLKRKGFIRHAISIKKGSKRPTVLGFTKDHKSGIYVLVVANHLTVCKEGIFYDTWDCGDSAVYSYWERV